jgi:hypothetical protein
MAAHRSGRSTIAALAAAISALASAGGAAADDFAVAASPPRFELTAKPGAVVREVLEIGNASSSAATFTVKTADWLLDRNAGVMFSDALREGSCRPWVAIERHQITVPAHGSYRFRFEVAPPADAGATECRFAIMIEGGQNSIRTKSGVMVPILGRMGVIVYLEVGGVRPALVVTGAALARNNGEPTPVVIVRNTGQAHDRLAGFLSGVDAHGARIDFAPSTLPILPAETRAIPLLIDQPEHGPPIHVAYPITIHGRLSWSDGSTEFSQQFVP